MEVRTGFKLYYISHNRGSFELTCERIPTAVRIILEKTRKNSREKFFTVFFRIEVRVLDLVMDKAKKAKSPKEV